jgi:ribosomal protein S18 acetylase RimI-like enzyme
MTLNFKKGNMKKILSKQSGYAPSQIVEKKQKANKAFIAFEKAAEKLGWTFEKQDLRNSVQYPNRLVVTHTPSLIFNGFNVGYFRIIPNGEGLEMSRIQVNDAFREKGMATLMMAQMMQIFLYTSSNLVTQIPFKILVGDVGFKANKYTQVNNDVRLKLYTKFGFQAVKEIDNYIKLEFVWDEKVVDEVLDKVGEILDFNTLEERMRNNFSK